MTLKAYCVNWPLFQNAAERFSFLRKCELYTWKKHRIDIVLTVCWVSFVIKKTGIEICFSVIQHQLIFLKQAFEQTTHFLLRRFPQDSY